MQRQRVKKVDKLGRTLASHLAFIFILLFGALVRIMSEVDDGNVVAFSMLLAFGIIIAVSLFNQIIIDSFNGLNEKWRIINYCIPAVAVVATLLIFKTPLTLLDIIIFPTLILIADLAMYAISKKSSGNWGN